MAKRAATTGKAAPAVAASTHGHGHGHGNSEGHGGHHGISPATYWKVFAGLIALLILTLFVAMFDLGPLNVAVAMIVAVAKVGLILTFFMHLKISTKLVRFCSLAAFFWLAILFVLTLSDYASRGWLPQSGK